MNKPSQKRLVDRLMDAYVSWREACVRVSDAYGSWVNGRDTGDEPAFEWYVAALEQEERAAEVYGGLVRRAGPRVSREHDAVKPLGGAAYELARDDASGMVTATCAAEVLRAGLRWAPGASWLGSLKGCVRSPGQLSGRKSVERLLVTG